MVSKVIRIREDNLNWLCGFNPDPNKAIEMLRNQSIEKKKEIKDKLNYEELEERTSKIESIIERLVQFNKLKS